MIAFILITYARLSKFDGLRVFKFPSTVPSNAILWDDGTPILWDDSTYILWD